LNDGEELEAELCILGAGIIPATKFLDKNEFKIEKDESVVVDEYMKAREDVYAAGDIARFPFVLLGGHMIRVEHIAYSQYQGRIAARNMVGKKETCKSVPFFWTSIFGKRITYAGHAHQYDDVVIDGKLDEMKFAAYFLFSNRIYAVIAVGRDPIASKAAELFLSGSLPSADQIKAGQFL